MQNQSLHQTRALQLLEQSESKPQAQALIQPQTVRELGSHSVLLTESTEQPSLFVQSISEATCDASVSKRLRNTELENLVINEVDTEVKHDADMIPSTDLSIEELAVFFSLFVSS